MESLIFYFFSLGLVVSALRTITHPNPAYGALYLALSMVFLSGIFFLLGSPFLAFVQLIIYAGAVMVLFVMVLMLFEVKKESLTSFNKKGWFPALFLMGLVFGVSALMAFSSLPSKKEGEIFDPTSLALKLFTKYILVFELIGLALLLIAVGAVALSRLDKKD